MLTTRQAAAAPPGANFKLGTHEGRSFLITPEGKRFLAFGANHTENLSQPPAAEYFTRKYANDWERAKEDLLLSLKSWGFNALGDAHSALWQSLPYMASQELANVPFWRTYPRDRALPTSYGFPDVFSAAWQGDVQEKIRIFTLKHRTNRNLIGYFWTDTPTWDLNLTRASRGTDWVSELRKLEAHHQGKQRYALFLKERYEGRQADLKLNYGVEGTTVENLAGSRFESVALGLPEVSRDDWEFLGLIAEVYYTTAGTAQKKYDPDHLVFGDKYLIDDCPVEVLTAARKHVDVISFQTGDGMTRLHLPSDKFQRTQLQRAYSISQKPILICDHQISFPTTDQPRATWTMLHSIGAAAAATEKYLIDAFDEEYIVGYFRCQYVDRGERFPGRGLKRGLVARDGTPYEPIVAAYKRGFEKVNAKFGLK